MKAEEALKFDSEHRLRAENLCYDIDTWYPKLKQFTFDSLFIPFTRREAECILAFHDVTWRNTSKKPYLSRDEVKVLQNLEQVIDSEIKQLLDRNAEQGSNQEKAVFLRLCGRSPKDGEPYDRSKVFEASEKKLAELLAQGYPLTANTRMIAISLTKYMKVKNGKDAMSLLLTSERVFAEMLDWTRFGEPEQICLRLWEDDLTIDYEFRAFCCRGRLTAITQYDHYTHYPYLFEQKEMLKRGIYDLWKTIHPHVNEIDSSYVIDIAYLKSSNRFILVELSPFTPCTGPALFHWQYSKSILDGSYLPPHITADTTEDYCSLIEFRLKELKDVHPELKDIIEVNWDMRWKQEKPAYDEYFQVTAEDAAEWEEEQSKTIWQKWKRSVGGLFSSNQKKESEQEKENEGVEEQKKNLHYLFVYGTLKTGFHWNTKYLHSRLGARFLSPATTVKRYALVVGDSGVPYLLGDIVGDADEVKDNVGDKVYSERCHQLIGELWQVDDYCLQGLDDYEGLQKGYYERITIPVTTSLQAEQGVVEANVYVLTKSSEDLRGKSYLEEYTLTIHEEQYKPIKHIQVKQCHYYVQPSTWGKTSELIEGAIEAPEH